MVLCCLALFNVYLITYTIIFFDILYSCIKGKATQQHMYMYMHMHMHMHMLT